MINLPGCRSRSSRWLLALSAALVLSLAARWSSPARAQGSVDALVAALGDKDPKARADACQRLAALGPRGAPARQALLGLLADEAPLLRSKPGATAQIALHAGMEGDGVVREYEHGEVVDTRLRIGAVEVAAEPSSVGQEAARALATQGESAYGPLLALAGGSSGSGGREQRLNAALALAIMARWPAHQAVTAALSADGFRAIRDWSQEELMQFGELFVEAGLRATPDASLRDKVFAVLKGLRIREPKNLSQVLAARGGWGAHLLVDRINDESGLDALVAIATREDSHVPSTIGILVGMHDARAVPLLARLVSHKDYQTREAAIKAAGAFPDARTIDPLTRALTDENGINADLVAETASALCASIIDDRFIEIMKSAPHWRARWGTTVRCSGDDPRIGRLIAVLSDPDEKLRARAAATLGLFQGEAVTRALLEIVQPPAAPAPARPAKGGKGGKAAKAAPPAPSPVPPRAPASVRRAAVASLPTDAPVPAAIVSVLLAALTDPDDAKDEKGWPPPVPIRRAAAEKLGTLPCTPAIEAGLTAAVKDPARAMAGSALSELVAGRCPGAAAAVAELLGGTGVEEELVKHAVRESKTLANTEILLGPLLGLPASVRWDLVDTLAAYPDPRAVAQLQKVLVAGDNERLRRAAAESLTAHKTREAALALAAGLKDKDIEVRRQVATGVAPFRDLREVRAWADQLLAEARDPKRNDGTALDLLGRMGEPRAVPVMIETLRREAGRSSGRSGGPGPDAAQALGRSGGPAAVVALAAALGSDRAEIREAAVAALITLPGPRAVDALLGVYGDGRTVVSTLDQIRRERFEREAQDPEGARRLAAALAQTQNYFLGLHLGAALAAAPAPDRASQVRALLADRRGYVRYWMLHALDRIAAPAEIAPFLAALKDPDEGVRAVAELALSRRLGARLGQEPAAWTARVAELQSKPPPGPAATVAPTSPAPKRRRH